MSPADDAASAPPTPGPRVVTTALGITQILGFGSTYYLPAVLAKPIAADTGWPLSLVVGAFSFGLLVSGLVSPHVGRTIDRFGGRPVLAASSCLIAAGQATLGLAGALPVYVLGWLILGAGMGAGLYDAAFATLGRLYGEAARRAIIGVTLWGGLASTVCWPLSAYLVETLGWRGACLVYAAIQLTVSLPIHWLLVPRRVPVVEHARDTQADEVRIDRWRRRALVLLGGGLVIGSVITSVIAVHLLTLLQARGLDLATAVALGALVGPAQVASRMVEMTVGIRLHPLWTMTASVVLMTLGLLLLAVIPQAGIALVLYGAGNGVYSIARGTVPLALFGRRGYGALIGRLAMPALLAAALSPSLGAYLIEIGGPGALLGVLVAASALNVVLVLALRVTAKRIAPVEVSP
ncbi:MFS transporter [Salinarimonas soli]|uniref:MFS transporter n=1 Tax=Salinarimonas soli TaxID=1638099 RepID=A0A5B2VSP5_9HYPH|nr:MFS transporter [Salinarimonas soli]KAA2242261.1 MFS transporter [Salinarimonas soli]